MGIRLHCPNGHKVHVKSFLAGKRGVCPECGAKFDIPAAAIELPGDPAGDEVAIVPDSDDPSGQTAEAAAVPAKPLAARAIVSHASAQANEPDAKGPLDLESLAQLGGSDLLGGRAFGPAAKRLADREKNARTMRILSLSLVIAMTLLACVLMYMIFRSH
jgi:hypothetical protein